MADTVRIDETAQAAVAAHAQAYGISLSRAASELICQNASQTSPPPSQPAAVTVTLDAAAEVLLTHLPPELVEKMRELCQEYQTSPAAYLLSYAKLANDRGELSVYLSPDDRNLGTAIAQPPVPTTAQCEFCKKTFKPERPGQKFCPEPEDWDQLSCGRQALLAELHKRRPPESQRKNIASRGMAVR